MVGQNKPPKWAKPSCQTQSVLSYKRRCLTIANQRIIFDLKSHAGYPRSSLTLSVTLDAIQRISACI